ncbi:MAG: glycoside hydrolase family 127 protein [Clostridia bacterium]|nr:glycoside hydrolase family 127 protein [Clostridia bacterium]
MNYSTGGANYTGDKLVPVKNISYDLSGRGAFAMDTDFIKRTQLYNVWLWKKFVAQFRAYGADDLRWAGVPDGWRSEYWGKMMRGASLVCAYSGDETLYAILTESVKELLATADSEGRITTYSKEYEFNGWDLWGRKYVLLGLQYYLEICRDEALAEKIVDAMCRHADRIMDYVGKEQEGKKPINKTTSIWGGLNSSSILEPFVRLYNLTGEQKYLDFSEYIVSEGGCDGENIFEAAYEDKKAPYEYAYVKAYEMMSCFEGLIEYARTTKNEHYRQAAINFGYKLLKTDVTVIGCCGCTHELFDNSARLQTRAADDTVMQETCVTVTWMKLCSQLLRLTGDRVFADAMEQSFCNAYLGALNTHEVVKPLYKRSLFVEGDKLQPYYSMLTFDSYSPLTADSRGRNVGGLCAFREDNTYYGCCACIGSAGIGLMGKVSLTEDEDGIFVQYYVNGRVSFKTEKGYEATLCIKTNYPYSGEVGICAERWDSRIGALKLRIPAYSKRTSAEHNGRALSTDGEYICVPSVSKGDMLSVVFDMRVREILPPYADGPDAEKYAAYAYGPVLLAKDRLLGDYLSERVDAVTDGEGYAEFELSDTPFDEIYDARLAVRLRQKNGGYVRLVDYSSAGKTLDERSKCAVWLLK